MSKEEPWRTCEGRGGRPEQGQQESTKQLKCVLGEEGAGSDTASSEAAKDVQEKLCPIHLGMFSDERAVHGGERDEQHVTGQGPCLCLCLCLWVSLSLSASVSA